MTQSTTTTKLKTRHERLDYTLQYIYVCCLAGEMVQVFKCVKPVLITALFPLVWMLLLRRRKQF